MKLGFIWEDFLFFIGFLSEYFQKKLHLLGYKFEEKKDIIVSFLVTKRGRYSKPFLNFSFSILIVIGIIAAPIIASSYPTSASEGLSDFTPPSATLISTLSQEDYSMTTEVSDKPRNKVITYTVLAGDTISKIAEKFGVSSDSIKWANNLTSDTINVGTPLKVPPVTGVVHKVKPGETVYSVAKKYQTDAQKIVNFPFNDFADLDTFALAVGQTLIVPDGTPPEEKPIYSPSVAPQYLAGAGTGQFIWPTSGGITQYPVWYHLALDIASNAAPNIYAADNGRVVLVQQLRYGYGWHIIIDHGGGFQTLYGHMQRLDVNVGDPVTKGVTVIGRMGSTGRSTGTHLHFEIRKNGVLLNPLSFLK